MKKCYESGEKYFKYLLIITCEKPSIPIKQNVINILTKKTFEN